MFSCTLWFHRNQISSYPKLILKSCRTKKNNIKTNHRNTADNQSGISNTIPGVVFFLIFIFRVTFMFFECFRFYLKIIRLGLHLHFLSHSILFCEWFNNYTMLLERYICDTVPLFVFQIPRNYSNNKLTKWKSSFKHNHFFHAI